MHGEPVAARRELLGSGRGPEDVLRQLAQRPGLACLWGDWAGGGALVLTEPLTVADGVDAIARQPAVSSADPDVVGGGWFGWLGYSGGTYLAYYDHLLRWDGSQWWFESLWTPARDAVLAARKAELAALLDGAGRAPGWSAGPFDGPAAATHLAAVEDAIGLIRAGECYEVNICTRLHGRFTGSAVDMFACAAATARPAFGALVVGPDRTVASLSPELFLERRGRDVSTAPIKGTRPRTPTGRAELRGSAKDAAENVMIVDLMRNDLNRVCEPGTVTVPELLTIEAHPGVWHLVSTVTGRLREDVSNADLLRATFPPGSVTGAPKLRAVDAIADIETVPRQVYTGAIGFAAPTWGAQFNVAIRTFEIAGDRIELGVGGGVTVDSVPVAEWHECRHKAAPLLAAVRAELVGELAVVEPVPDAAQVAGGVLETILAVDGRPLRLGDHLARLDRSVRELYGVAVPEDLAAQVRDAVAGSTGRVAVRAAYRGGFEVSAAPIGPRPLATAARVVPRLGGVWRHKWLDRSLLDGAEARLTPGETPLFVGPDGTVLETSRGNVFLLTDAGELVTPPLREDLLPGTTRRAVLDLARDTGRRVRLAPFTVADLRRCAAFWTSSLSGLVPITEVDGIPLPSADGDVAALAGALGF